MDDMRSRYRLPGDDERPVHEALRHAYQPPPRPRRAPPRPTEPAPQPAHHVEAIPAQRPHYKKPRSTVWPKLTAAVFILAVLAAAGIYAYPRYINPNPFPANIQHDAHLSLLYPGKLPPGYQVDKTSFSLANDILIYAAVNGGKRIVFTLQKTPSNFDFTSFYKQQLSSTQQFQTPYGQATVGKNGTRYLASLPAGDTWLLLSTSSPAVSIDDMSTVIQSLRKY